MKLLKQIYYKVPSVHADLLSYSLLKYAFYVCMYVCMYVCERFTRAVLTSKWFNICIRRVMSSSQPFFLLSPGSIQAARSCAHWQRRYRSGASRRRCPAVNFLLRSLGSLGCRILSTEPREGLLLLAPGTKNDASVPKRRCRDVGASGVAAWLAAGAEREVCRGRGPRPKLTDAAKHPSEA